MSAKLTFMLMLIGAVVLAPLSAMAISTITSDQPKPEAVEKLISESLIKPKVRLFDRGTKVRELIGRYKIEASENMEDVLIKFLEDHKEAFGIPDPRGELVMTGTEMDNEDNKYNFVQTVDGYAIWGNTVEMETNPAGELIIVVNRTGPAAPVTVKPAIKRQAALSIAAVEWKKVRNEDMPPAASELIVYNDVLTYDVKVPVGMLLYHIFINATDGSITKIERIDRGKSKNCH